VLYIDTEKFTTGDMKGLRTYQKGMIEPGLVALTADWRKLYGWACVPSASNMGGALGRVKAEDFWQAVSKSLAGDTSLMDWVPDYVLDSKEGASNVFTQIKLRLVLLANGNFLRPEGLELPEEGAARTYEGHMKWMFAKSMAKIATLIFVLAKLNKKEPRLALTLIAAYVPFYFIRCEPVFRASWHMAGSRRKNALPVLMQSSL